MTSTKIICSRYRYLQSAVDKTEAREIQLFTQVIQLVSSERVRNQSGSETHTLSMEQHGNTLGYTVGL